MNNFEREKCFDFIESISPEHLDDVLDLYKERIKDFNIETLLKLYDVDTKYNIVGAMFKIAEQLNDISLSLDDIKSAIDKNNLSKNNS